MLEKSFAVLVAGVCLVLLARLFMPERYRWRLDARAQSTWQAFSAWTQSTWQAFRAWAQRLWRWRSSRKQAARIAEEAIRRARHSVQRDGNVLRPKSFGRPRNSREPREPRDSGEPRKPH